MKFNKKDWTVIIFQSLIIMVIGSISMINVLRMVD